jgi:3-methylcrotonyl-CoA carboxylase alpha subunit
MRGCAMEVRICAESPARGFMPSIGEIEHLRLPAENANVRVDAGVRRGDRITQYYDSLIAKLVVWGEDRACAARRLRTALGEFELVGVESNLDLLRLVDHPLVVSGDIDTGLVERDVDQLTQEAPLDESDETLIVAAGAAAWLADLRRGERAGAAESGDPWSPWVLADGWRLSGSSGHDVGFNLNGRSLSARIWPLPDAAFRLETRSGAYLVGAEQDGDRMILRVDGVKRVIGAVRRADGLVVIVAGRNHILGEIDPLQPSRRQTGAGLEVSAPLPARVTRVCVELGDRVTKGAPLVVLEAMKMEITLRAPQDGVIADIRCAVGEMAPDGVELIVLGEDEPA